MDDLIRVKPILKQVVDSGSTEIVSFDFMLHGLIVNNKGSGRVTVLVQDLNGHTKVLLSVESNGSFNHDFSKGWSFWRGAKLVVVKENGDGFVDVSVGISKIVGSDYSIWRL